MGSGEPLYYSYFIPVVFSIFPPWKILSKTLVFKCHSHFQTKGKKWLYLSLVLQTHSTCITSPELLFILCIYEMMKSKVEHFIGAWSRYLPERFKFYKERNKGSEQRGGEKKTLSGQCQTLPSNFENHYPKFRRSTVLFIKFYRNQEDILPLQAHLEGRACSGERSFVQ